MSEEIQEIERLIKQSGELADALIRLTRKLQEQKRRDNDAELHRLHAKLTELTTHVQTLSHQSTGMQKGRLPENATSREQTYRSLQTAVGEKSIAPDQAAERFLCLAPELSASQKIFGAKNSQRLSKQELIRFPSLSSLSRPTNKWYNP
jgi:hypothetical protein